MQLRDARRARPRRHAREARPREPARPDDAPDARRTCRDSSASRRARSGRPLEDPAIEDCSAACRGGARAAARGVLALLEPRVRAARRDRRAPVGDRPSHYVRRAAARAAPARRARRCRPEPSTREAVSRRAVQRRAHAGEGPRARGRAPIGQLWTHHRATSPLGGLLLEGAGRARARTAEEMHAFQSLSDVKGWRLGWGLGRAAVPRRTTGSSSATAARCRASSRASRFRRRTIRCRGARQLRREREGRGAAAQARRKGGGGVPARAGPVGGGRRPRTSSRRCSGAGGRRAARS